MQAKIPVHIYGPLIERLNPIIAYRLKTSAYSRCHTLDQEKEHKPTQQALVNEALEFYLDLIAPIESTPADRMLDHDGELDFRFIPWCGNTPTPQQRDDFQNMLKDFIHTLAQSYLPSNVNENYWKKEKK